MKKLIALLSLVCLSTFGQGIQTGELPHQTFWNTFVDYFTSFNTNLDGTFANHRGEIFAGPIIQEGAHNGEALGLSYRLYKDFSLESMSVFADVTGRLDTQCLGIGYSYVIHDIKLTALVEGGWEFETSKLNAVFALRAQKALSEHTSAGIELRLRATRQEQPSLLVFAAVTF